ncbi:GNAT family N-acetyltransferase [Corynebacterium sp. zg-331]|uniref:GNAT family N-acetyltransferase n=1 Tax=unclassified Corynebacterium TaxID=2624378 RepID=UPI00128E3944|nr:MULTISPECIES: N-acetyltransferase [unclassified Corynebacterium]MBC3185211.1 GNAT family N-acetyltransferase [Corynebacterium sp. zg-331]MPV51709.1 GNAT family N-acetyltransferase [Corynebacterium sp. zg331]
MGLSIRKLSSSDFLAITPALVDVYLAAMRYPSRIRDNRIAAWHRDSAMPGFHAFCALRTPENTPRHAPIDPADLAAIAYGFHGCPDTWWHQQVHRGLLRSDRPVSVLDNYFEVTEVHVSPRHQGHGLGRTLLSRLLDQATEPTALLSTPEVPAEANRAFRLYRSLGFRDVLRSFSFPGDSRPFAILGATLPLSAQRDRTG